MIFDVDFSQRLISDEIKNYKLKLIKREKLKKY